MFPLPFPWVIKSFRQNSVHTRLVTSCFWYFSILTDTNFGAICYICLAFLYWFQFLADNSLSGIFLLFHVFIFDRCFLVLPLVLFLSNLLNLWKRHLASMLHCLSSYFLFFEGAQGTSLQTAVWWFPNREQFSWWHDSSLGLSYNATRSQ